MTLQASGAISIDNLRVECQGSTVAPVSLNNTTLRSLSSTATNTTISMSNFYNTTFIGKGVSPIVAG